MNRIQRSIVVPLSAAILFLSGCGGGSPLTPSPGSVATVVTGALTKGPVSGATIEVFNFDRDGQASGAALATTTTDTNGEFNLTSIPPGGPFLVVSSGGQYFDESDKFGQRNVVLAADEGLESLLLPGASSVAINPYTQALLNKIRSEATAQNTSFLSLIESNIAIFSDGFGFNILTTIPGDPLGPTGSGYARAYAMTLGGAANAIAAIVTASGASELNFDAVLAFAEDLSDGQLDGQANGQAVTSNGQPIPDLDLNQEIRRFRNNNDAAYRGVPAHTVDELPLSAIGTSDPEANRPPVGSDDSGSLNEGASLSVASPGVLANDSDLDGDTLTAELINDPLNASGFTLNANGGYSYTHDGSETISDSFTYRASDGRAESALVTVTLTISPVNDAPQITRNELISVATGGTVSITPAKLAASDPDNTVAELTFAEQSPAPCGSFEVSGGPASSFTQDDIDQGRASFNSAGCAADQTINISMAVTDAPGDTTGFTMNISISGAANQGPVNTIPVATQRARVNRFTSINDGLSVNDPDADPAADIVTVNFTISRGTLTVRTNAAGGVTPAQVSNNVSTSVTIDATLNQINTTLAAVDGLQFDPEPDFLGTVTLTVTSDDNGASGSGGPQMASGNRLINVQRVDVNFADGARATRLNGQSFEDVAGVASSPIVDFNGDGLGDFLITNLADDNPESYVILGRSGSYPADADLNELASVNTTYPDGFVLRGAADGSRFGVSAGGGDFNGDGFDDFVIGAERSNANGSNSGSAYLIYGSATPPQGVFDVTSLNGSNGNRFDGMAIGTEAGRSVSLSGDVNNDGFNDLVIGLWVYDSATAPNSGGVAIVYGTDQGLPETVNLADLDGDNGVLIEGESEADVAGFSVDVSDIDGDGNDDIIIGAPLANAGGQLDSGRVYVVYGSALSGNPAVLELSALNGINGFVLDGIEADGQLGFSVAGLPDLNADGFEELIAGAVGAAASGAAYVVYGAAIRPASTAVSALNGLNGFTITSSDTSSSILGSSVRAAGDFDNDGNPDILLGDFQASPTNPLNGIAYVLYNRAGFPATLDLGTADGRDVLWIPGASSFDFSGLGLAGGGDINGDGIDDIVTGSPGANQPGAQDAGEAHIVFGFTPTP